MGPIKGYSATLSAIRSRTKVASIDRPGKPRQEARNEERPAAKDKTALLTTPKRIINETLHMNRISISIHGQHGRDLHFLGAEPDRKNLKQP